MHSFLERHSPCTCSNIIIEKYTFSLIESVIYMYIYIYTRGLYRIGICDM